MKSNPVRTFIIDQIVYYAHRAPISIDNYAEYCVSCGSADTRHVADIIQYGLFADRIQTLFTCDGCGANYFFDYIAMARASDTYITLFDDGTGSILTGDAGRNQ